MYLIAKQASNPLLSPILNQWIKKLYAQGLKSQQLAFEVYINLEDDEEVVRT